MPLRASRLTDSLRDPSVMMAVCALAAQVGFRTWALFSSWFYTDDYRLLLEAEATPLSVAGLLDPFDSQFMPLGLLVVEAVESSGELNWALAAAFSIASTALAGAACYLMLVVLFGRGWRIIPLFVIYLTTCITVPALMWWAAALNQLVPQTCFFVAVTCWVLHLRTGRARWAVGTGLVVALALGFYVKALLIVPALAFLTLGYHYRGSWADRFRALSRDRWRALVPLGLLAAGYIAYYRLTVPQPFAGSDGSKIGDVGAALLGETFPTALLGGPWRWWNTTPPIVLAQPPDLAVSAAWVVISLVIVHSLLTRRNAWPGWLLLAVHVVCDFALLATSRGQEYGAFAGMDYRYLTDAAPAAVLATGLVFLRLRGAPNPSSPRRPALLTFAIPATVTIVITSAICIGGVISSAGYVHYWHHHNAGKDYVPALARSLHENDGAVLIDQTMPVNVMPGYSSPMNRTSEFVRLIHAEVTFAEQGDDLLLVDDSGRLRPAMLATRATTGQGPRPGCGWLIGRRPKPLPVDPELMPGRWWARVGVLSSASASVTLTVGSESRTVDLPSGLTSGLSMFETGEEVDHVSVSSDSGARICVDRVDLGDAVVQP